MVRGCLLIYDIESILIFLDPILLDLQQRHALILLDQHFRVGEPSRLSDEKCGVSGLLRGKTLRLLLLFQLAMLREGDPDKASLRGYFSFIKRSLRGSLEIFIFRWWGGVGAWWFNLFFVLDEAGSPYLFFWAWRRIWVWWWVWWWNHCLTNQLIQFSILLTFCHWLNRRLGLVACFHMNWQFSPLIKSARAVLALEGLFSCVDVGVFQVVRLQMESLATARMVADKVFHFVVNSLDVPPQGIICGIGRATPPKIAFALLLPLLISRTNHDHLP